MLKYRQFVCCCIFFLTLPWSCLCGEGENAAAQMVSLEVLIERFNQTEEKGVAYEKANPPFDNWGGESAYACQLVNAMGRRGDRAALPFLEGKCRSTNLPSDVRARAAAAYVKIADLDESVEFMRKLYAEDADKTGHWRYMLNQQLLEKFDQAKQKSEVDVETSNRFYQFLVAQVQTPAYPTQAAQIDAYLIRNLPGYETSKQRAVIGDAYASSTNEWRAKTFNPIKAHFDQIPPSKRVDLRSRFPGLPPLPEDKNAGKLLKVALAVGATLVAACAAILIALKRRRTRNRADAPPDNPQ